MSHISTLLCSIFFMNHFFFFGEIFNLWRPLLIIALYYQTQTPINIWYKWGLNPRFLIQPSETLPVELTKTHMNHFIHPWTEQYMN